LSKGSGPVEVQALQRAARNHFGVRRAGPAGQTLMDLRDVDIEALCFIVMMEAAKDAEADLKAMMEGLNDINKKAEQRTAVAAERTAAAKLRTPLPTPTPAPDRIAQF